MDDHERALITAISLLLSVIVIAAFLLHTASLQSKPKKGKAARRLGPQILSIEPQSIPAGKPSLVTVSANGKMSKFVLDRLDANGKSIVKLGHLNDLGLNGDSAAGDGIYSLSFVLNEPSPGSVRIRLKGSHMVNTTASMASISVVGPTAELSELLSSLPRPDAIGSEDPRPIYLNGEISGKLDSLTRAAFGEGSGIYVFARPSGAGRDPRIDLQLSKITPNLQAKARAERFLKILGEAGLETKALRNAFDRTVLASEGPESGGIFLPTDGQLGPITLKRYMGSSGAWIFPFRCGSGRDLQIYPRSNTNTVILSAAQMESLLVDRVVDPLSARPSAGMTALFHELLHIAISELGCFEAGHDGEEFVKKLDLVARGRLERSLKAPGWDSSSLQKQAARTLIEIESSGRGRDSSDEERRAALCLQKFGFQVPKLGQGRAASACGSSTREPGCRSAPANAADTGWSRRPRRTLRDRRDRRVARRDRGTEFAATPASQ